MTDKLQKSAVKPLVIQPNKLRRKLINSAWAVPVVMSVNLPVHAQTSLISSCRLTLSTDETTVIGGAGVDSQSVLMPTVSITITNTGQVPLDHPSASPLAGLSYSITNVEINTTTDDNGGIPNPLMPDQSHTVTLTELGIDPGACSAVGGGTENDLVIRFSRNGSNCTVTLLLICIND